MHLSERDVRDIATYTRIALSDEQLTQMTVDLNNIIDTLAPITEIDLEGVAPTFHPIGDLSNVMRDDEVQASFPREVALSNTTAVEGGAFRIPSILGGGDE